MREDVTFGGGCAGWHYVADVDGPRPCVVMAHGFGATRDGGIEDFAEAFAAAGYDALLFDYCGFGASNGNRPQTIDPAAQREDYAAAVTFAREADGVDADHIVVWGTSFAGGQVLQVAAEDPRIAAVIAMTPAPDGLVMALHAVRRDGLAATGRLMLAALQGKRVPITAPPGGHAVLTTPGAHDTAMRIAGPTWINEVDGRIMLRLGMHRPGRHAKKLDMPVLVQVADEDRVVPPHSTMKAAWDAEALVRHYPCDHFDVYPGGPFHEAALKHQVEFLQRTIPGAPR